MKSRKNLSKEIENFPCNVCDAGGSLIGKNTLRHGKSFNKNFEKKKNSNFNASSDIGIEVVKKFLNNNWEVLLL